jgi:SEC-C motif-containing protein
MRSRYSAYCRGRRDYLRATWHPRTLAGQAPDAPDEPPVKWIGLQIIATRGGGPDDDGGEVEFVARCRIGGRAQRLHEIGRFARVGGRWVYVDGERGATDSSRLDR